MSAEDMLKYMIGEQASRIASRRIEARSFADSPAAMLTDYGVVERYEYDAYGRRSVMTAGFAHRSNSHYLSDLGLTGREIDELDRDAAATPRLQHMHYRHRDYSPQLGRFLQHDPLGLEVYNLYPQFQYLDGLSVYNYVAMNPINNLDPEGKGLIGIIIHCPRCLYKMWRIGWEWDDRPEPPTETWCQITDLEADLKYLIELKKWEKEQLEKLYKAIPSCYKCVLAGYTIKPGR